MKPLVVPFIKTAIEGHQMYLLIFYFHASSKTNLIEVFLFSQNAGNFSFLAWNHMHKNLYLNASKDLKTFFCRLAVQFILFVFMLSVSNIFVITLP